MLSDQNQTFRLKLNINKIRLKVRFSCSVSCTLKVQGKQYDIHGQTQLKNGQASMKWNHSQTFSLNVSKTSTLMSEKKLSLLIYLKSTSGKIPAGTVQLPLHHSASSTRHEMARIDKCPDKNAFIEYDFFLQNIDEKSPTENASVIEKIFYPRDSDYNPQFSRAPRHISPSRNLQNQHIFPHNRSQILRGSHIDKSIGGRETLPIGRLGSNKDLTKRSSLLEEYYNSEKGRGADQERIFTLERQVESTKTKLTIVESELNSKATRVIELEKDFRQATKKVQNLQLELRMSGSKIQVLEKTNKQLTGSIKKYKEQLQEEKLSYENIIKRVQIRELSSKEQVKALTEKLYAAQNQKQRLLFDKNVTSNQFEDRQKRIRDGFKDKEKKVVEERTSLLRKMDSLEKQLEKSEQQLKQTKAKNTESTQAIHQLKLIIEALQTQNDRYRVELSNTRYELTKTQNEKRILEQIVQSNSRFNEERRNYRKKLNQKETQLVQIKQKLNFLETNNNRTKVSYKQTQKIIKQKAEQLKLLERDYNILLKEHKILSNEYEHNSIKLTEVMEDLQYEMKKSSMFETKCSELECQLQQEKENNQIKAKQSAGRQNAMEEQIERINVQLCGCNQNIKTIQRQYQQLQQELEQKVQHIHNLQSTLIQLNQVNQTFQFEKVELAQQKRTIQQNTQKQLEEANEEIKQLRSKLQQIKEHHQSQINSVKQKFDLQQFSLEQFDGKIKERQNQMAKFNAQIIKLERQIKAKDRQLEEKEQIICQFQKQKAKLLTKNKELSKKIQDMDTIQGSLRQDYSSVQGQLDLLRKKLDKKQKQLEQFQQFHDIYKTKSIQALDALFPELSKVKSAIVIEHSDTIFCTKINTLLQKIVTNNEQVLTRWQRQKQQKEGYINKLSSVEQQKHNHIISTSKSIELLKQSSMEKHQELVTKKSFVEVLRSQIVQMEEDHKEKEEGYEAKAKNLNKALNSKNKQITQLKQKLNDVENQMEAYQTRINELTAKMVKLQKDRKQKESQKISYQEENQAFVLKINELDAKILKLQKEKKQLEAETKKKVGQMEANLRLEMQHRDNLQVQKGHLEKQLKQQKQNVKKALRELQNKCYEYDNLETQYSATEGALKIKQTQAKKAKTSANQLKHALETLLNCFIFHEGVVFQVENKLEPLLSKFQVKQNVFLYEKIKSFVDELVEVFEKSKQKVERLEQLQTLATNLKNQLERQKMEKSKQSQEHQKFKNIEVTLMQDENQKLKAQIIQLQEESKKKEKQKAVMKKQFQRLKVISEEESKKMEQDHLLIKQLMQNMDEQKQAIESIKRLSQDIIKNINVLEKDKKVSVFAMATPKELLKKMEILVGQYQANHKDLFESCKSQWNWAVKGLKKRPSMKFQMI